MATDQHPDAMRVHPDPSVPPPGPGLRVLVVEDDADLAAGLAGWLGRCGHEALVARDGPAALGAAGIWPPDVVLLDLGLPGMDGFEVAERIHKEIAPAAPKAPLVIAVTGRNSEDDRRRSAAAGIDLHLPKPVDPGRLDGLLRRFQTLIS